MSSIIFEYSVKYPSMEISWVPNNITKGLPTPNIIFVSGADYGGCYVPIGDHYLDFLDPTRPNILVDIDLSSDVSSVIAHEYRHHWQLYTWGWGDILWEPNVDLYYENYESFIVEYYQDPYEFDALLYEYTHTPNDDNIYNHELIMKSIEIKPH